jgi:uncharacterized protein
MMLSDADKRTLLEFARESIEAGLNLRTLAPLPARSYPESLQQHRSAFVTLHLDQALRGCCGSIEPSYPLFEEVWRSAAAAAFGDPRFPALRASEWPHTHVHVSVLERLQPMPSSSEEELLNWLQPGVDGVVLQWGHARATFLPSVWEQLPDKRSFLQHLKAKAGWPVDFWSPEIQAWRYGTESFEEVHSRTATLTSSH